ncbi:MULTISPECIES: phosphodiester glycosidase family protein [Streptomyces]|uniref:Phosphodiester glycosidase family protein n=1 Tax=Streptomyces solicathayae TaxID=3081768 RepID=A0ABZ0LRT3_9ACTN|nr:phosphodiester glycosidase family protein [Streptomyces sp. HUAS YS2]WOX21508.1 phosphodiester glycosidase family protein [Streptomyces sp. HUAS YS2]
MGRPAARRSAAALALVLLATTGACTASPDDKGGAAPRPTASPSVAPSRSSAPTFERTIAPGVGYQESTRRGPAGPVRIAVLRVAPDAEARLTAVHGRTLAVPQTVRQVAGRVGALAAVNGSYFDIQGGKAFGGYQGDPVGLYAEGGRLLSEARNDGAALLLGQKDGRIEARITEVSTRGRITAGDGAARPLDGVDRVTGRLRACGGADSARLAAEGRPLRKDARTGLCSDPDEIVEYTSDWGVDTPGGRRDGVEAVLAQDGTVRRLRSPGSGPVPRGTRVLQGIGAGADWLRDHARTGERLDVAMPMTDPDGTDLTGLVDSAIGGGARLLENGRVALGERELAAADRPPRTLAGVTADGAVLLVTVDGRDPGVSEGATLAESAELLRSLGAVDGLNLDGGGSTSMVVDGELRNSPREAAGDPVGERKVATAIAVLPR